MLYTIAVVLVILWLLGLATSCTMGGLIHVLRVIAVATGGQATKGDLGAPRTLEIGHPLGGLCHCASPEFR